MLSLDEIKTLNLPLENIDDKMCLYVNAALDWLERSTTLDFNKADVNSVKNLPSGAKLFIISFAEIMIQNPAVTNESIAGMSQSFNTRFKSALLTELAAVLLGEYYSHIKAVQSIDKWRPSCNECKVEN